LTTTYEVNDDIDPQNPDRTGRRQTNRMQERRRVRRLRILLNRLKLFGRIGGFVLIAWVLFRLATIPSWHLDKNIFTVYPSKHLEIEGYNILSTTQILNKLREVKLPDEQLYLIDTAMIERKLEKELPPVNKVIIRRYWLPSRLRIYIDERTPVISITPNPKIKPIAVFTLDSKKTRVLEKEYLPLPGWLPTYTIVTYDDYRTWKPALIPYLKNICTHLENATGDSLEYLDIRNPDDVYAQTKNIKLRIGAIKGNEVIERVEKVSSVIPEAMKIKDSINYIDLRWDNISIKLKNDEPAPEEIKQDNKQKPVAQSKTNPLR
jgi:hypothetical protein